MSCTKRTARSVVTASYGTVLHVDPRIRITVNGKLALTVEQAAARVGVTPGALSGELTRYKDVIRPVAALDGLKKLYLASEIDRWWASRPGKGTPGKRRPRSNG